MNEILIWGNVLIESASTKSVLTVLSSENFGKSLCTMAQHSTFDYSAKIYSYVLRWFRSKSHCILSAVRFIPTKTLCYLALHTSIEDATQTYNFQTQCFCCIQFTEQIENIESCTSW